MPTDPVVVNALALRPQGAGVSTYIEELLGALPPAERTGVTALVQADARASLPAGIAAIDVPACAGLTRAARSLLADPGKGVFHGLDVDTPLRRKGPVVVTVHDLSAFDTPWAMSRARAAAERALITRNVRRADTVIAVSEFTADRAKVWLSRTCEVIREAPRSTMTPALPHDVQRVREHYRLPPEFIFSVGSVEPRKDQARLAAVCQDLEIPLVLAGGNLYGDDQLPASVRRLGYVPTADLAPLYGAATVVAYTSVYEGFGLPPLEAMACGAAVLCTAVADLRGLCEDGAVVVPVADTASLTRGLRQLLGDEDFRGERQRAASAVAGRLSWAKAALETVKVWRG